MIKGKLRNELHSEISGLVHVGQLTSGRACGHSSEVNLFLTGCERTIFGSGFVWSSLKMAYSTTKAKLDICKSSWFVSNYLT